MRLKTLLLGSAAAFAFAGGSAQAADLSVAEPVDYVRVCDAFGAGYWYIPGTDTCIRIGGEVEFRVFFGEEQEVYSEHTGSWHFRTQFDLNVTTKSMTDWGPLTTFINLTTDSDTDTVTGDEYYLSLGPILLGLTQSSFDVVGGGYTKNYGAASVTDLSDDKVDQVQLSWAINGFGLILALEDGQERWGTSESNDFPDLVAALTASGTGWDAAISFLYADLNADTQLGVQGKVEFEVWGDQLLLGAMWADNGGNVHTGSSWTVEDGYAVIVSYQHNWASNLYSAATFEYFDDDSQGAGGADGYRAAFTTAYSPADGLWAGVDLEYLDNDVDNGGDSTWFVTLFAEREFGG